MDETKRCPKCGEMKAADQFYRNKHARDGLSAYCKPCSTAYHVEWRRQQRAERRRQVRAVRQEQIAALPAMPRPLYSQVLDESSSNALGVFVFARIADPDCPCHSIADIERHSGVSREALSRYFSARVDRWRPLTIGMLVAIADALDVGLIGITRAAAQDARAMKGRRPHTAEETA